MESDIFSEITMKQIKLTAPAARRQVLEMDPKEVSLVSMPANLESFVLLKNQEGGNAPTDGNGQPVPAGVDAITAAIADLAGKVTGAQKLVDLDDLKKALEQHTQAPAQPEPAPAPAAGKPGDAGFDMAAFAAELTKSVTDGVKAQLVADGVIEAPKSPAELVAAKLEEFEGEVKKSFGQITDAMGLIVEQIKSDAPAPPASGQTTSGRAPNTTNLDLLKSLEQPAAPAPAVPALTAPAPQAQPSGDAGLAASVFMQALAAGQSAPTN